MERGRGRDLLQLVGSHFVRACFLLRQSVSIKYLLTYLYLYLLTYLLLIT